MTHTLPHVCPVCGHTKAGFLHCPMHEAAPDLLAALEAMVARVEIANKEGDPIMSAWLPDARAVIARAKEG